MEMNLQDCKASILSIELTDQILPFRSLESLDRNPLYINNFALWCQQECYINNFALWCQQECKGNKVISLVALSPRPVVFCSLDHILHKVSLYQSKCVELIFNTKGVLCYC